MNDNYGNEGFSLVFDLSNAILQKWNTATETITKQQYYNLKGAKGALKHEVIRDVTSLFMMIRGSLKKSDKYMYDKVVSALQSEDINKVIDAFDDLDDFLYKKGVTKFDTRQGYDRTRAEIANKVKGM